MDALHRPSRHDLSALSTTIRYLPSCRGVSSLSAASSLRSLIGDARFASSFGCPTHAALRSGTTKCVWCMFDRTPCWPIRREGNGSRERRLMRSRVSLAELFHVSIYETRSRRFLSLGLGRTFIILRKRIKIEVKIKEFDSTSVTFTAFFNQTVESTYDINPLFSQFSLFSSY